MAKTKDYDVHSIQFYKGLEGVRKKPSMYLGSADSRAINHCAVEIIGNAIDEASNKHAKNVAVRILEDGGIVVQDDGRGIPVGPYPKDKTRDTLTILATELHSGGKMDADSGNYTSSLGTHGMGLAVVNAVSAKLEIWSYRNNTWNTQTFKRGQPTTAKPVKVKSLPKDLMLEDRKRGTVVRFYPDASVFEPKSKLNRRDLADWINEMAWLVTCRFDIMAYDHKSQTYKKTTIHRKDGLKERFAYECERRGLEPVLKVDPFYMSNESVDIMIGWVAHDESIIQSSVSGAKTAHGGTHMTGFNKALKDCFETYRKRNDKFTIDTLQTGMIAIVNVKIPSPKFTSQDKTKLVSPEAADRIYEAMTDTKAGLTKWLANNKKAIATIIDRANQMASLHEDFKASAKLAAAVKTDSRGKSLLPKELKASLTDEPNKRELFIVEGDSAGGCLAGDAEIIYGIDRAKITMFELSELARANPQTKSWPVMSYDQTNGKALMSKGKWPVMTKTTRELIEVEMSDGTTVRVTPEHPFLTTKGKWVRADQLQGGEELRTIDLPTED